MAYLSFHLGPKDTPATIKIFSFLTIIISVLCLLSPEAIKVDFARFFRLSWEEVLQGRVWQFITSIFVLPSEKISFGFIFHLTINLALFTFLGRAIVQKSSLLSFLLLYLLSGIAATLTVSILLAYSYPQVSFSANSSALLSLGIGWLMLYPEMTWFFPGGARFKAKWLILPWLGITLLFDLAYDDYISLIADSSAIFFSYFLSLFIFRSHGPFFFLGKMEERLFALMEKKKKKPPSDDSTKEKIFLNDDEFIDAMLEKISLYGKESLSDEEKRRMEEISKSKKPFQN